MVAKINKTFDTASRNRFFPWPAVEFVLKLKDVVIAPKGECRVSWEVLSVEHVGVLDASFLPGAVGVCEIDWGAEFTRNVLMFVELGSVVGGDGLHTSAALERQQCVDHSPGDLGGHLAVMEVADDGEQGAALDERELEVLAFGVGHQVHFPVSEARAVGLRGTLLYADTVLDGDVFPNRPAAVLELEAAVLPQVATLFLVLADIVVDAGL